MKTRLLLIELHHLGDAVMSLPFVRGATGHFEVHVLCRPESAEVYRLLENPPVLHAWNPPWSEGTSTSPLECLRAARDKGRELAELGFAATVCAWADPRTTLLAAAATAPRRLGFPTTRRNFYAPNAPGRASRLLLGRFLEAFLPRLTHPLQAGLRHPHIERWSQMAGTLGFECNFSVPWIPVPSVSKNPRPVLGIHRHARLPSKQWPMGRWDELMEMEAVREKFEIVEIQPGGAGVPAARDSASFAKSALSWTDEPMPHTGGTPVPLSSSCIPASIEPGALKTFPTRNLPALVAALNSCDAVVCHDSFPAHLAAALGKPVVTLFGSGEPDWFAPWSNRARVVHRRICPLHPCIDRCGMDRYICLETIPTADILRQLELLTFA